MRAAVDDDGRVQISRADFTDPRLPAFLQAHLDDIEPTAPPESRHALDLSALQRPHVRLWVATEGEDVVGTAALAGLEAHHEELKSMRTEPRLRGRGVASRLLTHLLDDARTFSPPDANVRVALRRVRAEVELIVEDEGPGIPEHALERIFERFYTDRPEQGFGQNSGLGLSIARQIVEAHGGRIRAENRLGGDGVTAGARFEAALRPAPVRRG